jgi:dCMP deaminase
MGNARPSRDDVGLMLVQVWAMRGTCARRRVGCVLVDADGYPLASGYNGPAAGMPHCTERPCPGAALPSGTGLDVCEALHAEWNAIARCPDVRRIDTCYVTSSPCVTCTKMLLNTACRRIVFLDRYAHDGPAAAMWEKAGREWVHRPPAEAFPLRGDGWESEIRCMVER